MLNIKLHDDRKMIFALAISGVYIYIHFHLINLILEISRRVLKLVNHTNDIIIIITNIKLFRKINPWISTLFQFI